MRVLDSARWRRWAGSGTLGRVFKSPAFRRADLRRRHMVSRMGARRIRHEDIESVCLMIGHTKSGGSLIGALLDAHPEIAFADELDVVRYVEEGFDLGQIAYLIQKASRRETMKGRVTARRLDPYSLAVPGQAQGTHTTLRIVGDARAGITTQRLGRDPEALPLLNEMVDGRTLRFVHVVRNPFDPISAMRIRGHRSFGDAVDRYFENCAFLDELRERVDLIHTVRYESLVADPGTTVTDLCSFVGVEPLPGYLAACGSLVGDPRQERTLVDWSDREIQIVEERIARHDFLHGYTFAPSGTRQ